MNFLDGSGVIFAPHMDDGTLGCGGMLARLPHKKAWHVVYATDGMRSPEPDIPWRDPVPPELGRIRQEEARSALSMLGIPAENVHFMGFPDGKLSRHKRELCQAMTEWIRAWRPDHVLVPFRYDRHPDHLVVNRVGTALVKTPKAGFDLIEYFVYGKWRLLPERYVQNYIRPELLRKVDIKAVAAIKRAALDAFKSQTTCFFDWQVRPTLSEALLDQACREPERFLPFAARFEGASIFARSALRIRVVHGLEPWLHKRRNQLSVLWRRMVGKT